MTSSTDLVAATAGRVSVWSPAVFAVPSETAIDSILPVVVLLLFTGLPRTVLYNEMYIRHWVAIQ